MNTVALLFLCEIDEGAYVFLLSEPLRSEVEKQGRVQLTGLEAAEITASKTIHVVLIVAAQIGAVWGVGLSIWSAIVMVPILSGFVAFWLAGVIDAVRRGNGGKEEDESRSAALGVAIVTGQVLGSLIIFATLFMVFGQW